MLRIVVRAGDIVTAGKAGDASMMESSKGRKERHWLKWPIAAILGGLGLYLGSGLGVAGGAYLRETGKGFVGEAEQFWLEVCLAVSLLLIFSRATRWASLALSGAYIVALAIAYWAGYHWGNFLGWHTD